MGKIRIILLGILGLQIVACSDPLAAYRSREVQRAPQSEKEVGVLVRRTSETDLARTLEEMPEVQFRELNPQHQYYEVYGASEDELQRRLPNAIINKNEFFTVSLEQMPLSERIELAATKNSNALEKCEEGENPPTAKIEVLSPKKELAGGVLELNTNIQLNGSKSVSNTKNKKLRLAFIILSPTGSLEGEKVVMATKLQHKVTALGGYGIGLVVQDERNVCGLELLEFSVTANPDFKGADPNLGKELAKIDLSPMRHLVELNANEAWGLSQGLGQIIAIIDSGVNYNHITLRNNLLINSAEIPDNKIDDDKNGFVDDVLGWDFQYKDNHPYDDFGHGSHVAGLAASEIHGMARQAKYLALKSLGAFGGDVGSSSAAIRYAVDRGARVLNLSFGSYNGPHPEAVSAVNYAESKGAIIVAAAGNGHPQTGIGMDTDVVPHYPSALPNDNVIAVASKASKGVLSTFSNFGAVSVDIAAPGGGGKGDEIVSSFIENPKGINFIGYSGTSMATPIVSGVVAQLLALNPKLSPAEVKAILMKSGQENSALKNIVASSRYLDPVAVLKTKGLP